MLKDKGAFQRDLDRLEEWTNRNCTKISKDRCEALHMGRKNNNTGWGLNGWETALQKRTWGFW